MAHAPSWIFESSVTEEDFKAAARRQQDAFADQGAEDAMTDIRQDGFPLFEQAPARDGRDGVDGPLSGTGGAAAAAQWTERGNAFFRGGALDDAVEAYRRAIRLDPAFGVPYGNLALTYLTRGEFAEAIGLYQKSIELLDSDKDKALSWNGLGNAFRCLNDYTSAVNAYQRAADLDPETNGIRERAEDFLSPATPTNAQEWNDLGEFFLKTGTPDEAIDAFSNAIELGPESGLAYCNLSRALAAGGKYQEAMPLCQKSIELLKDNKDKAAAWNHLGNVYRKLNDYDRALASYQKAVALGDPGAGLLTRARFSLLSNCHVNE
jgi:tetratricopeptide (TPR) repeat protein